MLNPDRRRDPARIRAQAEAAAKPILAQSRAGTAPLEETPMRRYRPLGPLCMPCLPSALPDAGMQAGLDRVLEALNEQNQLLVDLLGAVNALNAATLSIQNRL